MSPRRRLAVLLAVDDGDARIAPQVGDLLRVGHHPQQHLAVDEIDLARTDARPAVAAQRPQDGEVLFIEGLLGQLADGWAPRP